MKQVFKHRIQKKYRDELFGSIVLSYKFSYLRKRILDSYKLSRIRFGRTLLTARRYYKLNFLHIMANLRRKFRFVRNSWIKLHLDFSSLTFFVDKRKIIPNLNFYTKIISLATQPRLLLSSDKNRNFSLDYISRSIMRLSSTTISRKSFYARPVFPILHYFRKHRGLVFQQFTHIIKRLEKQKTIYPKNEFFYMVHIASPKPLRPRRTVFALKQMYLRKLGVYMGFERLTKFIRVVRNLSGGKHSRIRVFGFLESRLSIILLRVNFFTSIYMVNKIIENGFIMVNNRPIYNPNYILRPSEVVTIERGWGKKVYGSLLSRLNKGKVLINYPHHLEVDYKLLAIIMVKFPNAASLTSPASFDLHGRYGYIGGIV